MTDRQTPAPRRVTQVVLTVAWLLLLIVFFRWWELTLTRPALMLWSALFVVAFVGTAWLTAGRELGRRGHPVWRRAGLWLGLVLATLLFITLVPLVRIGGVPVRTVALAGLLDAVVPVWVVASALSLVWEGPARWPVLAAIPLILVGGLWAFVVRMPGSSYRGLLDPLTDSGLAVRDALRAHVRTLAVDIGERSEPRYAATQRAAAYLEGTLRSFGYQVRSHDFQFAGSTYRNLEVVLPGSDLAEEIVVVGAHYDTAEDTPGADDNATGVAGLLELARRFRAERPRRTVRFVLFANEEPPFFATEWMGSFQYAARAKAAGDRIVAMISLETIGYFTSEPKSQAYPPPFSFFYPDRGDFIGFVGNLSSGALVRRSLAAFRRQVKFPSEGVAAPTWIPGVTWSDHLGFWQHGFKAIMITDTAPFRNPFYHTSADTIDRLDFDRMTRVVAGIAVVVRDLAE